MGKKILLVDNNPAVQALTALALADSSYELKTIANAAKAFETVIEFSPDYIIVSSEIAKLDVAGFAKDVRKQLKETLILLLCSEQDAITYKPLEGTTIARLLVKPIKSNRLREEVESLATYLTQSALDSDVLLVSEDERLTAMLGAIFSRCQLSFKQLPSLSAIPDEGLKTLVIDWNENEKLDSSLSKKASNIVLLKSKENSLKIPSDIAHCIERPLSFEKLSKTFSNLYPEKWANIETGSEELSAEQIAKLAGEISVSIFGSLLHDEDLKAGNTAKITEKVTTIVSSICSSSSD